MPKPLSVVMAEKGLDTVTLTAGLGIQFVVQMNEEQRAQALRQWEKWEQPDAVCAQIKTLPKELWNAFEAVVRSCGTTPSEQLSIATALAEELPEALRDYERAIGFQYTYDG